MQLPDPVFPATLFFPMPDRHEQKPAFDDIPLSFRTKLSAFLVEEIIHGEVCQGSLSASASFVFTLDSGRKVFAKGNHPEETSHGTQTLRQEILVYQKIPLLTEISPRYLGSVSDGDDDGWMLGLWDYLPSTERFFETESLYSLIAKYFRCDTDLSFLKPAHAQSYIGLFFSRDKKWQRFKTEPQRRQDFLSLFENQEAAGQWLQNNLDHLCCLQDRLPELCGGPQGLIHGDLRLDNILLRSSLLIIDWPNACRGPVIFDLLFLFASLESQGLGKIETHLSGFSKATGIFLPLFEQQVMAAGIAGFFAHQAFRSVPEKMPRLRWMQKSILLALLLFLARQGVIESVPRMTDQSLK